MKKFFDNNRKIIFKIEKTKILNFGTKYKLYRVKINKIYVKIELTISYIIVVFKNF